MEIIGICSICIMHKLEGYWKIKCFMYLVWLFVPSRQPILFSPWSPTGTETVRRFLNVKVEEQNLKSAKLFSSISIDVKRAGVFALLAYLLLAPHQPKGMILFRPLSLVISPVIPCTGDEKSGVIHPGGLWSWQPSMLSFTASVEGMQGGRMHG